LINSLNLINKRQWPRRSISGSRQAVCSTNPCTVGNIFVLFQQTVTVLLCHLCSSQVLDAVEGVDERKHVVRYQAPATVLRGKCCLNSSLAVRARGICMALRHCCFLSPIGCFCYVAFVYTLEALALHGKGTCIACLRPFDTMAHRQTQTDDDLTLPASACYNSAIHGSMSAFSAPYTYLHASACSFANLVPFNKVAQQHATLGHGSDASIQASSLQRGASAA
jgi:hypothetical protein